MRLIDAYALADNIYKSKFDNPHMDIKVARNHGFEHDRFLKMVCLAPTVDAVEVVHGRWVEHRPNVYECTACHTWYGNYGGCEEWAYCPHCGAKMDGGNENA